MTEIGHNLHFVFQSNVRRKSSLTELRKQNLDCINNCLVLFSNLSLSENFFPSPLYLLYFCFTHPLKVGLMLIIQYHIL